MGALLIEASDDSLNEGLLSERIEGGKHTDTTIETLFPGKSFGNWDKLGETYFSWRNAFSFVVYFGLICSL
jgi:hypothetical protein